MGEETLRRRGAAVGTRQRMLDSALLILRERGAAGVTIDAVLAHSGAPRGSVYHHFPGGRSELILGAVRQAGGYISAMIDGTADGGGPQVLERLAEFWRRALIGSDFRAGCPAVAMTVDSRHSLPEAAVLVDEIFARWRGSLARRLMLDGVPADRAERLATVVVAAFEGAILLCRAHQDLSPLDDVVHELTPLLEAATRRGEPGPESANPRRVRPVRPATRPIEE